MTSAFPDLPLIYDSARSRPLRVLLPHRTCTYQLYLRQIQTEAGLRTAADARNCCDPHRLFS